MTDERYACPPLPPLRLASTRIPALPRGPGLAPFRRGLYGLVALALPVLGTAFADQVHRAGIPGAPQAAAPRVPPIEAAAAPRGPGPRSVPPSGSLPRWHP
ncbi:hypothetical protein [Methylobacterium nigriterrae]|uniref:hypothetical protein n=1 Tax=Methylobacterium nigriterrae TaxID=3127512 RepID=UPI003013E8A2